MFGTFGIPQIIRVVAPAIIAGLYNYVGNNGDPTEA